MKYTLIIGIHMKSWDMKGNRYHKKSRYLKKRKDWTEDMKLTKEERFLMMLYSPGSRQGLLQALQKMRGQLAPDEIFQANLTDKVLGKLSAMSDNDFEKLDFVAGLEGEDVG